ncbi:MAG: DUF4111 domain-containing protein [Gammaproteobacteria bacterium]|nr:DUF4111 domain-containing protein [Gammaproteobacteria bacterium]
MTITDPRIPVSIRPLLQNYLQQLQAEVPDLLLGVYLHGSITYGAFCEHISDIDILAVTTRICSTEDLEHLKRIHADLKAEWPQWKLEVSYVPQAECSRQHLGTAPPHPYHHQDPYHDEGVFFDSGIFDFNSPLWADNLWWMVKTQGIALLGPEPAALEIQTSAADIVATSRTLVESHWPQWTRPRERFFKLGHAFDVDWVVFGTLRTYYTLRERDITSKPGAAEYGFTHLPKLWHGLIRETLEYRHNPVQRGIITRARIGLMAALYLHFILHQCRRTIARD